MRTGRLETPSDPRQQLRLAGEPAAAIMAHAGQEFAQRHLAPASFGVCLVEHGRFEETGLLDRCAVDCRANANSRVAVLGLKRFSAFQVLLYHLRGCPLGG